MPCNHKSVGTFLLLILYFSRHSCYSQLWFAFHCAYGCFLDRCMPDQSSALKRGLHFRCHLLDLPWEDVLVPHILCYLPLQHLVSLQRVSKQFHSLIQVYLANCKTFDLSSVSSVKCEFNLFHICLRS